MTSDYNEQIYANICATTLPNKRSRTNREDKQQSVYISLSTWPIRLRVYVCILCTCI